SRAFASEPMTSLMTCLPAPRPACPQLETVYNRSMERGIEQPRRVPHTIRLSNCLSVDNFPTRVFVSKADAGLARLRASTSSRGGNDQADLPGGSLREFSASAGIENGAHGLPARQDR